MEGLTLLMAVRLINETQAVANNAIPIPDILGTVMSLISRFVIIGGALWVVWGLIVLGGGLIDKTGPKIQAGIWQIIGGGVIIAGGALVVTVLV